MKKLLSVIILTAFVLLNACQKEDIPPVIADFNYVESANGLVYFNNVSQNADSFEWDFGTGDNSKNFSPTYQFAQNKDYFVTLTAKGRAGQNSKSKTIRISNIPTTGRVVFWTAFNSDLIKISVNGTYVGVLSKYMPSGTAPNCNTEGFVTVNLSQGSYNFTAKEDGIFGKSWSGTINVTNGQCRTMQLTK